MDLEEFCTENAISYSSMFNHITGGMSYTFRCGDGSVTINARYTDFVDDNDLADYMINKIYDYGLVYDYTQPLS